MAVCEQRILLAHQLGKRYTSDQKRSMDAGNITHARQDQRVRFLYTLAPVWTAFKAGVLLVVPMSLLGQYLANTQGTNIFLRVIGSVLTLPGTIYSILTNQNAFANISSMMVYFLLQTAFYALLAFLVLAVFHSQNLQRGKA